MTFATYGFRNIVRAPMPLLSRMNSSPWRSSSKRSVRNTAAGFESFSRNQALHAFSVPRISRTFSRAREIFCPAFPLLPASPAPDPWRLRTPSGYGLLRRKVSVPASPRGARHTKLVRRRLRRRLRAERRSYPHSWCNVQARTADWQVGRKHWCLPRWKPFAVRLFRRKISKQSESWWRPEGTAERSTSRLLPPGPATHHSPFLKGDSPAATSREQLKTVDP